MNYIRQDAYSSSATDSIKYYFLNSSGIVSLSSAFSYVGTTANGEYYRSFLTPDSLANQDIYYLNKFNNSIFVRNVSMSKINNLNNFSLSYDNNLKKFSISWNVSALPVGYNYNAFYINLYKQSGGLIKSFYFNDSSIANYNVVLNDGWTIYKAIGRTTYLISYPYDLDANLFDKDEPIVRANYYYTQNIDSTDYKSSLSSNYYYTMLLNTWRIYESGTNNEFSVYDITSNPSIVVVPTINDVSNPCWSVKLRSWTDETIYYPSNCFGEYELELLQGTNFVEIYDSFGELQYYRIIDVYSNFLINNMTLKDSIFGDVCESNITDSSCNYESLDNYFFIESKTDGEILSSSLGDGIETAIFCERNGSMSLMYSNFESCSNQQMIGSVSNGSYWMTFQSNYNKLTHESLYDYLYNNTPILALDEWDFTQNVLNFYKGEDCSQRFFFVPKNVNCVVKQFYYDVNSSKQVMNVSFVSTKSIYDMVHSSSDMIDFTNVCSINPLTADVWTYLGFASCKIYTFLLIGSSVVYQVGFLILALILSKFIFDLFKVNK
jgi:hypothetical protein